MVWEYRLKVESNTVLNVFGSFEILKYAWRCSKCTKCFLFDQKLCFEFVDFKGNKTFQKLFPNL